MEGNSFATVATQIINYNNNVLNLLSSLNDISVSNKSTIPVKFSDNGNVTSIYNIPSLGYLQSEINRLNNNINSLYSIDINGALIQPSSANKYKKIITVDLNREPASITGLSAVSNFVKTKNWFFDSLTNPMLSINLDLQNLVEDNVRECLVRRYIVNFIKDENGDYTNLGQSALNSFDDNFRNTANIPYEDFLYWVSTTPGIYNQTDIDYDEQKFELDPNEVLYDGVFSVLKIEEDTINNKLWYHLNTLDYIVTDSNEALKLSDGNELIINVDLSTTRYKVIEVSTSQSNPRVRLERVEGIEPVPVIAAALKIYSPVIYNKNIRVSIGYDERNVIFAKAINTTNYILSKDWGNGIGIWTNDLSLISNDNDNGKTMVQFYQEKVLDYGQVLKDLVSTNIPSTVAVTPNIVDLVSDNFKVVQINRHLTDSTDTKSLTKKHNYQKKIKSEITQIDESIRNKSKSLKFTKFSNYANKREFSDSLSRLYKEKNAKAKVLQSTVDEIISLSSGAVNTVIKAKYKVRGFWDIPNAAISDGSKPQEIIQFKVQYRYLSKDGSENPVEPFKIVNSDGSLSKNAVYSNWEEMTTDMRKRVKDDNSGEWVWITPPSTDSDAIKINQLEIPIQKNERVEIRIKSISEAGWPNAPFESDWSETLSVEFPDSLQSIVGENARIIEDAKQEELRYQINEDLETKGLGVHLSNQVVINDKAYMHDDNDILLTGIKDSNSNQVSLFDYIYKLEERLRTLEEAINRTKGVMLVSILRKEESFTLNNNEEKTFNIECEDYLNPYTETNNVRNRRYTNEIVIIKDFVLKIENTTISTPLGLLSNNDYYTDSDFLRTDAPQVFWVNDRDELTSDSSTGNTRTQIDNQFIWSANFVSLDQTSVVKLSENIGNEFQTVNDNSITNVLSSTEYSIGYGDNSILDFVNNNNSLLEMNKWVDINSSVESSTKLLTSIHPVVKNLDDIVEKNSDKVKYINAGDQNAIYIPVNIYFKMNSLDPNDGNGKNYDYIDLHRIKSTVRHIKKVRFYLYPENDNRAYSFTVGFNINRAKIGTQKITPNTNIYRGGSSGK